MNEISEYAGLIKKSPLFSGMDENDVLSVLKCLSAQKRSFRKGQYILRCGDKTDEIFFVLSGSVCICREDYWGNRNIISQIEQGQLFAETYACSGKTVRVDAEANGDTQLIAMNVGKMLAVCSKACAFHSALIRNLLTVISQKNLFLNEKLEHISQRSTREKLISYFSSEAQRQGSAEFDIPYNRQQLADYLSVERSAMSGEMSRMKSDGLIGYSKNHIILTDCPKSVENEEK